MDDKTRLYLRDIVSKWSNVLKTPENIHLFSTQLSVLCAMAEADAIAERDAARADCAKLGRMLDETLAERDALRGTQPEL